MQIEEPNKTPTGSWALFALGFRPFFLAAGFSAIVLMLQWLVMQNTSMLDNMYYPATYWHAHEMLFGYAMAVIAGFLLAAVRNWTDLPTPSGMVLFLMCLLWLIARVLPLLPNILPVQSLAIFDVGFLAVLTWTIAARIIKRRQFTNMIFIVILLLMLVANILVHTEVLSITHDTAWFGIYIMFFLIILLIVVMGGRVIPFFAERGVPGLITRKWKWIEWLVGPSIVLFALSVMFVDGWAMWTALAAMLIHLVRLAGWYDKKIWREPLVWILLLSYAWIVIGLGLSILAYAGYLNIMLAWHAFTIGGIGGVTLGMMSRVALGHTGREMKLPGGMVYAFVLVNVAAIIRVLFPIFLPQYTLLWVNSSGIIWMIAFLLFVVIYWPILTQARVDGRPG
jgi:uncharacterized protein involved in response to NO